MNRSEIEEISGEEMVGEGGLWVAVLLSLIQNIESPSSRPEHQEAKRIILQREGCFDLMAAVLSVDPDALQRRIIRYMKNRSCEL